jgi:hypothetical protein
MRVPLGRSALLSLLAALGGLLLAACFDNFAPPGDGDGDTDADIDADDVVIVSDRGTDGGSGDASPSCDPSDPAACSDGWECTVDSCDQELLVCVSWPRDEMCSPGLCDPSSLADPRGCVHSEAVCNSDGECDDWVRCTEDLCEDGVCLNEPNHEICYTPALMCRDGVCDPLALDADEQGCVVVPGERGAPCIPISACFGRGECDGEGLCVPLGPACDDDIGCTIDVCTSADGTCVHVPDDDACPVDAPFCRTASAVDPGCNPGLACEDGADCGDGVECNGAETCSPESGLCAPGVPVPCSDADTSCVVAYCDAATSTACIVVPNHLACDDHEPCTEDSCVADGGVGTCAHGVITECSADPDGCCVVECDGGPDPDC